MKAKWRPKVPLDTTKEMPKHCLTSKLSCASISRNRSRTLAKSSIHVVVVGGQLQVPARANYHPCTCSSMAAQEQPLPPTPLHLFRSHSSPVTALALSDDNERIYSADSSGKVAITSSRSLRAIAIWNAHKDSVLGVEEWDNFIITLARFFLNPPHPEVESYNQGMGGITSCTFGTALRSYHSLKGLAALHIWPTFKRHHYTTLWMSMLSIFVVSH